MYNQLHHYFNKEQSIAIATLVETSKEMQHLLGKKMLITKEGVFGKLVDSPINNNLEIQQVTEGHGNQSEVALHQIDGEYGTSNILLECYHPIARLLVLGAGHIAQPLVNIAALMQYQITVVDDRPTFANRMRFPQADEVVCDNFIKALEKQQIGPGTSVIIVTRGHKHDLECLEHVLKLQPGYVGMIGSRRRVKIVKEHLLNIGYSAEKINRVHMPIGLAIGAQTPEEIAVSIAAQLIEVRRGKGQHAMYPTSTQQHWGLLEKATEYIKQTQPVVSATIIRTKGSTPRKAGAKMLILPDGSCIGTIGGGCGEAEVRREALMLFDSYGVKLHRVMLDADTAAQEGMVCGGLMDVFIERLV